MKERLTAPQRLRRLIGALSVLLLGACAHPHNVDIALDEPRPEVKTTVFSQAMIDLGLMSEIYGTKKLHLMARDIVDNTGTSLPTQAEIPRDITEMLKSTLNGFGGNIVYIPYDPDFILNSASTGYSGFRAKLMPDVVVSGGITEFDRGLETRGKNTDVGLEGEVENTDLGFDFSAQSKTSAASITLDFNLIDFGTLAGIPRMQAINNIKVHKAQAEDSIAFSISGSTLGFRGSVKKIQGRHAAVRLLVQLSMIQVVGKYLQLPYWKLLPDVAPDSAVLDQVLAHFYTMDEKQRIAAVQEYLILNGFDVTLSGEMDAPTQDAIAQFAARQSLANPGVNQQTYLALYTAVPITRETLAKRRLVAGIRTQPLSGLSQVSADGRLRVSVNDTHLQIGEAVKVSFEVTSPMYVQLYNVSSTGEVAQLFPAGREHNVLVRPGQPVEIPPPSAGYELKVTGPAGVDRIVAFSSFDPLPRDADPLRGAGVLGGETDTTNLSRVELNVTIEAPHTAQATP